MNLKLKRIKELFILGFSYIKSEGFFTTIKKTFSFFIRRFGTKKGRFLPTKKALLKRQNFINNENLNDYPLISICVPLYNTPEKYLTQLLQSVTTQIYPKWELCLADASDEQGEIIVKKVLNKFNIDKIKYIKIENSDIATNTNKAVDLAKGDYIALCDHDDILAPHALFEMAMAIKNIKSKFIYSDEALFKNNIKNAIVGHFKPDFSYSYLLSCNYICHLTCFEKELFYQVGGFNKNCNGSQDYDLFLRLIEQTNTAYHIPKVLYYWRVHQNSTSNGVNAKPYVENSAILALQEHLKRRNIKASVEKGLFATTYKVNYEILNNPLVSVIIPNMEHKEDLEKVINSIINKTNYKNVEVVVVENNSKKEQIFDYYTKIQKEHSNIKVVTYKGDGEFNYSKINNYGRTFAKGDFILLLNNDVEVINENWLTEMVSQAMQEDVGAVGAMLYYPDDTIQHAGVITGLGGFAGHNQKYAKRGKSGYMFRLATIQDFSVCTAACLLVKTKVFDNINGLDEEFKVAFNDVDFCLRIRKAGYRIIFTPYAELYHYESKSRGLDEKDKIKKERFKQEQDRLKQIYGESLLNDPFYNINLTLDAENFAESAILDRT